MELLAWKAYKHPDLEIFLWRTAHGQEVDFLLNDCELAIKVKGSDRVHEGDLRYLTVMAEDGVPKKRLILSLGRQPRRLRDRFGRIEVCAWDYFLQALWSGEVLSA